MEGVGLFAGCGRNRPSTTRMIKASGVQVIKISTDLGAATLIGGATPQSDLTNFTTMFCGKYISGSIALWYSFPLSIELSESERESDINMTT